MMLTGFLVLIFSVVSCWTNQHDETPFVSIPVNLCRPCGRLSRNYNRFITMETVKNKLLELQIQTVEETCRYYNEIFNGDTFPVDGFNYRNIPINHPPHVHNASNIVKAYSKLTDISLYRELGQLQTSLSEGLKVNFARNKMRSLLCNLQTMAEYNGIVIPESVCRKQLLLSNRIPSATMFGNWMLAILSHSKHQLCKVKNLLSNNIDVIQYEQCVQSNVSERNCLQ